METIYLLAIAAVVLLGLGSLMTFGTIAYLWRYGFPVE